MKAATLGFATHTGWAAFVAVAGTAVVARGRVDMIEGSVPEEPPYVYHAARRFGLAEARRFVDAAAEESFARARETLARVLAELPGKRAKAAGIVVAARPVTASFESVLANHSLIHAAEGELYRAALRRACAALDVRVLDVRADDLEADAAKRLGVPVAGLAEQLAEVGRAAGKPWARDQKDAYLAAVVAGG